MTINFKTGKGGWGKYVLFGTKQKPRELDKIKIIDGDVAFAEELAKNNKFSGEYYKVLITVEKKLSDVEMENIYEDVKKNILHGLEEDEYYTTAVLHQDTEHSHIHMLIPKQNLFTTQHLQLYMHGIDTKRIEAIQDYVAIKHGLQTIQASKQILQKNKEILFVKEREQRGQEPFNFNFLDKKNKALAEKEIYKLIENNLQNLYTLEDVKELIHSRTNLTVVNSGYEQKKQFNYFTLQDKEGKKTRVKGELFSPEYFVQSKLKQEEQLNSNVKKFDNLELELIEKKVRADLKRENEKRYNRCKQLFYKGRSRAEAEQNIILKKGENFEREHAEAPKKEEKKLNDIRADFSRRDRERESVFGQIRENIARANTKTRANRETEVARSGSLYKSDTGTRTSTYLQFKNSRESVFEQAKRAREEREQRRNNNRTKIGEFGEKIERTKENIFAGFKRINAKINEYTGRIKEILRAALENKEILEKNKIVVKNNEEEYIYSPSR